MAIVPSTVDASWNQSLWSNELGDLSEPQVFEPPMQERPAHCGYHAVAPRRLRRKHPYAASCPPTPSLVTRVGSITPRQLGGRSTPRWNTRDAGVICRSRGVGSSKCRKAKPLRPELTGHNTTALRRFDGTPASPTQMSTHERPGDCPGDSRRTDLSTNFRRS